MKESLLVLKGKRPGEILSLSPKGETVIGRGEKADLQLDDPSISRRHFCISQQENRFFLQDMGSANGTFINGKRTLWHELSFGDKINFGSTQLQFLLIDEANPPQVISETPERRSKRVKKAETSAFNNLSVTQALKQIKPNLFKSEDEFPKLDLENVETASLHNPDIIYQKTRREPPFAGYENLDRVTKSLSTLYKVSELLHSQLDLKKLLEVLLETVLSITKAHRGCLLLHKSKDTGLEVAVWQSAEQMPISILSISKTIVNLAIEEGIATVSSDAMSDQRFCKDTKSSVVLHNIRSVMCVPLEGRERVVGAIYLDSLAVSAFDNEDLELLTAIGHQAGLAVERTLLQDEITRSEQKYRTIFEKAPFSITLVNQSGRIMDINPSGLKDILTENYNPITQQSILNIFPTAKQPFQKLLEQGISFDLKEFHLQNSQGNSIIMNLKGVPLMDETGQIEGAVIISEDITEAKKLQAQLIQQDKMATVGLLAAGVAHEFNNIVAGMMGYAQLMIKKKNTDPERLAQIVIQQCQRAKEVISRLLNFSRRKDIPKEAVKLEDLLEDVFQLVERELLKNNIQVVKNFEKVPQIMAQAGEIQQVFLNLVLNAVQAIGKNGTVTVSLKNIEDSWVQIVFQDTGIGIPQKFLPRIFEPFFTTKEKHGTGLGLAVTYSIIKSYGGEITVESEENKGAKFTIELPVPKNLQNIPAPIKDEDEATIELDMKADKNAGANNVQNKADTDEGGNKDKTEKMEPNALADYLNNSRIQGTHEHGQDNHSDDTTLSNGNAI